MCYLTSQLGNDLYGKFNFSNAHSNCFPDFRAFSWYKALWTINWALTKGICEVSFKSQETNFHAEFITLFKHTAGECFVNVLRAFDNRSKIIESRFQELQ